jgi:hypothetical protein
VGIAHIALRSVFERGGFLSRSHFVGYAHLTLHS